MVPVLGVLGTGVEPAVVALIALVVVVEIAVVVAGRTGPVLEVVVVEEHIVVVEQAVAVA